tara:strand:- start:107 stop:412 length:306 start_codon:yes stop_codon:yes gene_type:complete
MYNNLAHPIASMKALDAHNQFLSSTLNELDYRRNNNTLKDRNIYDLNAITILVEFLKTISELLNPAFSMISLSRAGPACAPRAAATFWDFEVGTHPIVENA